MEKELSKEEIIKKSAIAYFNSVNENNGQLYSEIQSLYYAYTETPSYRLKDAILRLCDTTLNLISSTMSVADNLYSGAIVEGYKDHWRKIYSEVNQIRRDTNTYEEQQEKSQNNPQKK